MADTGEIVPEYVRKYNKEGQDIVLPDINKATSKGIRIIQKNLSKIEDGYIRHNSDVIASSIMELVCNDLKFRDKESTPEYLLINSILEDELKRERKANEKIKKQKRKMKNNPVLARFRQIQQIKCTYSNRYKDEPFYKKDYEEFNNKGNEFKAKLKKGKIDGLEIK